MKNKKIPLVIVIKSITGLFSLFNQKEKIKLGGLVPLMFINSFLDVLAVGVVPLLISVLVDVTILREIPILGMYVYDVVVEMNELTTLKWGLAIVTMVYLVKNVYNVMFSSTLLWVCRGLHIKTVGRLFRVYQRAPLELVQQENSSEISRLLYNETGIVFQQVLQQLFRMLSTFVTALSIFTSLLFVDWVLTFLIIFVLLLLFPVYGLGINSYSRAFGLRAFNLQSQLVRYIEEGFQSTKESRSMGLASSFEECVIETTKKYSKEVFKKGVLNSSITPVIELVAIIGLVSIVLVQILVMDLSIVDLIPTLSLFSIALIRLRSFVANILSQWNTITYRSYTVSNIVDRIVGLEKICKDIESRKTADFSFNNEIIIEDVGYTYPNSKESVLENVNYSIKKGSKIAILGETGAGKTTLVDIILGLIYPSSGRVLVDGVSVERIRNMSSFVAYVPQYVYLRDVSIRDNLQFYNKDDRVLSENELWKVLRMAQLDDIVRKFDKQLDHVIGENGKRLSGGQRQRLGIARALLRDPEILVLDEGTSALDEITEGKIANVINNLPGNITVLLISHRKKTVEFFDSVIKVENKAVKIM